MSIFYRFRDVMV